MTIDEARRRIEDCCGFDDPTSMVGEAWDLVKREVERLELELEREAEVALAAVKSCQDGDELIDGLQSQLVASQKKHRDIYYKTAHEVEQILGKALGCPWFKDDLKNFPDATAADGVCVGEHVPESIAEAAANRIVLLESQVTDLESQRDLALEEITGLRAALHDAESAYSQLSASQERERILREGLKEYAQTRNWAHTEMNYQYRNWWMRWENGYDIAERTLKAAEEVKG